MSEKRRILYRRYEQSINDSIAAGKREAAAKTAYLRAQLQTLEARSLVEMASKDFQAACEEEERAERTKATM
jgi:hypothetical protein